MFLDSFVHGKHEKHSYWRSTYCNCSSTKRELNSEYIAYVNKIFVIFIYVKINKLHPGVQVIQNQTFLRWGNEESSYYKTNYWIWLEHKIADFLEKS